MAVKFKEKLIP